MVASRGKNNGIDNIFLQSGYRNDFLEVRSNSINTSPRELYSWVSFARNFLPRVFVSWNEDQTSSAGFIPRASLYSSSRCGFLRIGFREVIYFRNFRESSRIRLWRTFGVTEIYARLSKVIPGLPLCSGGIALVLLKHETVIHSDTYSDRP